VKKVLVIYNGGTIGMQSSDRGYVPMPGYLQQLMAKIPAFSHPDVPDYDIIEQHPLMDSANMYPDRWWSIAQLIEQYHARYAGFVILHGTDTLAYTASALPFMLQGLRKPVILTGSQIPLCEVRNDAQENLITSLILAARFDIPEVCLYFGGRLLRGCRSTKLDASGLQAFGSPNYPWLGEAGIQITIHQERLLKSSELPSTLTVAPMHKATVGSLRLFPGISATVLENLLLPPIQGLVLESYGVGNGPANNPVFLRVLRQAAERGVVLVNCTQCVKGRVVSQAYATGQALREAGVVSGQDLTTEAALAKLFYLLSNGQDPEMIRQDMLRNICGELTEEGSESP